LDGFGRQHLYGFIDIVPVIVKAELVNPQRHKILQLLLHTEGTKNIGCRLRPQSRLYKDALRWIAAANGAGCHASELSSLQSESAIAHPKGAWDVLHPSP
jgi:hypothetical protein